MAAEKMATKNMAAEKGEERQRSNNFENNGNAKKRTAANPNSNENDSPEAEELRAITSGMSKFGFSSRGGFRKNKSKKHKSRKHKTRKHKSNKKSKKNNKH